MSSDRSPSRVAFVTGGRSGVGATVVESLLRQGWKVASLGRTPAEDIDNPDHLALTGDVAEWTEVVDAVHASIERFGELDFVFANAGVLAGGAVGRAADKSWLDMIDVNLTGAFNTIDASVESLVKTKGRVVFMSSIAIQESRPGVAAYTAAKAGVKAMADCLIKEVEHKGVRVTTLILGPTDTPMLDRPDADPNKLPVENVGRVVDFLLGLPPEVSLPELTLRAAAQPRPPRR